MIVKALDHYFEVMIDHKDAFDQEQFDARYSEVLDKYPIIVGDIGYEQLRLKGFYEDANKKADVSRKFSSIQDYLMEYCNFGCPYFVLRRLSAHEVMKLTAEEVETEEITVSEAVDEAESVELTVEEVNFETEDNQIKERDVQVEERQNETDSTAKTLRHFLK